jgi:hypothetical protein
MPSYLAAVKETVSSRRYELLGWSCLLAFSGWWGHKILERTHLTALEGIIGATTALTTAVQSTVLAMGFAPYNYFAKQKAVRASTKPTTFGNSSSTVSKEAGDAESPPPLSAMTGGTAAVSEPYDELDGGVLSVSTWVFLGKVALEVVFFLLVLTPLAVLHVLVVGAVVLGWNALLLVSSLLSAPPLALVYTLLGASLAYGFVTATAYWTVLCGGRCEGAPLFVGFVSLCVAVLFAFLAETGTEGANMISLESMGVVAGGA